MVSITSITFRPLVCEGGEWAHGSAGGNSAKSQNGDRVQACGGRAAEFAARAYAPLNGAHEIDHVHMRVLLVLAIALVGYTGDRVKQGQSTGTVPPLILTA